MYLNTYTLYIHTIIYTYYHTILYISYYTIHIILYYILSYYTIYYHTITIRIPHYTIHYVGLIPPSAIKYRNEAINYYNLFNNDLTNLLKLGNKSQLIKAQSIADNVINEAPKFLFKKTGPKVIARDPKQ